MGSMTLEPGRWLRLAMAGGALVGAAYLGIALYYGADGHAAVVRPGAYIHQQYARAFAEGRPYQFNPGEAPTTASPSHLYPAILAAFYKAGAKGGALSTAALLFNIATFIGFLAFAWIVAYRLCPGAAPLAVALVALSGQAALSALDQSEMGLFMMLSMGALAAALRRRFSWLAVALFLASLTRPEGLILSLLTCALAFVPRAAAGPARRFQLFGAGLIGAAAFGLTALLNLWLTGRAGYDARLGAGLGGIYPPAGLLAQAGHAFASLVSGALFGASGGGRVFHTIPLLGGMLGLIGIASRDWTRGETEPAEAWWWIAALAAMAMAALGGWTGVLQDRYLAWILPVFTIYIAIGAWSLANWLGRADAFRLLSVLLIGYQLIGGVYFGAVYAAGGARVSSNARFVEKLDGLLGPGVRVGTAGSSGMAYLLPSHTVHDVFGMGSPHFAGAAPSVLNAELLKHHPELRFDVWMLAAANTERGWYAPFVGEQILAETPALGGAHAMAVHRADWTTIEGAHQPRTTDTLRATRGMRLADALDVGYLPDERRAGYETFTRVGGAKFLPVIAQRRAGLERRTEIGRLVIGSESFTVRGEPGQPMRVVLRTASRATVDIFKPGRAVEPQEFNFAGPLTLRVFVNGRELEPVRAPLDPDPDAFSEIVFDVPAEAVTAEVTQFTIGGDHLAFAYWFYQPSTDSARASPGARP